MLRIFRTESFDSKFQKLDRSLQVRIERFYPQLVVKAQEVGKPLSGMKYFREKKFDGHRLYYLVYSENSAVLIIDVGSKKHQGSTIKKALERISEYDQYILDLLNNGAT